MKVKIVTESTHGSSNGVYVSDIPVIALAMAVEGAKAVNRRITDEHLTGAIVGSLITCFTVWLAIFNA